VLIDKSSGKKITTLEQLGGSLRILNSWESDVQTNEQGQAETIVRIRNKEYMLDNVLMDQLAEEGVTQLKDSGRDVQNKAQKKLHNK
jgi:hypothetical protein